MRQLLALPVSLDGGSRREAARTGGGGLQVIRDGVLRFKAGGAAALVTRKAPAKTPILTDEHRTALAATVEAGPKPDMDGIGRWVDPAQGAQEEPGVPVSRQTPGRDLRALGFAMVGVAKLSARPQHDAQHDEAIEAFNKTSATSSMTSAANGAARR